MPLLVEKRPNPLDRVLDQIFVHGRFVSDRRELGPLLLRQRVTLERDRDDRPDLQRDRQVD